MGRQADQPANMAGSSNNHYEILSSCVHTSFRIVLYAEKTFLLILIQSSKVPLLIPQKLHLFERKPNVREVEVLHGKRENEKSKNISCCGNHMSKN